MLKLLAAFVMSTVAAGCVSQARPAARVESPDPVVGDLKCVPPPMSILEALYRAPTSADQVAHCDASTGEI